MPSITPAASGLQGLGSTTEKAVQSLNDSLRKLSSGFKIGQAKDNAALLAIADSLTAETQGVDRAVINVNDGISAIQVADTGLKSVESNFQRIQELAVQSANGTLNDRDRQAIQKEVDTLQAEISSVVETTAFNGKSLLSGGNGLSLQSGPDTGDQTTVDLRDFSGAFTNVDLSTQAGAEAALLTLRNDSSLVGQARAELGAAHAGLESTANRLESRANGLAESQARISDTDFAQTTATAATANIRAQAGLAIQVQANQSAARVEGLL